LLLPKTPEETANRLMNDDERTERAAALLAIHAALGRMFSDSDRAAQWIGAPTEAFDGCSALDVMLADVLAGLRRAHAYLDAQIAG
jgi:predicted dienelactone hydrolase